MIDLDAYPRPDTGVIGRVVDGPTPGSREAVVVLPARGKIDVLNNVGARIWSLVDGRHSVRQIATIICDEYGAEQAVVDADLVEFLDDLVRRRAIVMGDRPLPLSEMGV